MVQYLWHLTVILCSQGRGGRFLISVSGLMSSVPLVDGMAENNRAHPVESLLGINTLDHAPNPIDDRPKKRQKIALACDMCRVRKVKCDGIRPGQSVDLQ